MSPTEGPGAVARRHDHRRLAIVLGLVVAVSALVAAIFAPYYSQSKVMDVTPGFAASTTFAIPYPAWVTVHFDHHGKSGMIYWMEGPAGIMFNHPGMGGKDTYSFATWGGNYRCGAEYESGATGTTAVWVNVTWGLA